MTQKGAQEMSFLNWHRPKSRELLNEIATTAHIKYSGHLAFRAMISENCKNGVYFDSTQSSSKWNAPVYPPYDFFKANKHETVFYSWISHLWWRRAPYATLLFYTYPPLQPIRLILTHPPPHIGLSTDIHKFVHHVFFHIWIAYGSWRRTEQTDRYHFSVRDFFIFMILRFWGL